MTMGTIDDLHSTTLLQYSIPVGRSDNQIPSIRILLHGEWLTCDFGSPNTLIITIIAKSVTVKFLYDSSKSRMLFGTMYIESQWTATSSAWNMLRFNYST